MPIHYTKPVSILLPHTLVQLAQQLFPVVSLGQTGILLKTQVLYPEYPE